MTTKHVRVGNTDCRITYSGLSRIARLYPLHGKEALAECQQYGKLNDGTPTLYLAISTTLGEADQKRCAAVLISAWHQGNSPAGEQS
jgi:hypothetical protein